MIMNNSVGAAAAGAVGGGLVTGGLLGLSVALMDPAMPQGAVLIGTAAYGGAVCGGILGALVAIVRSEMRPEGAHANHTDVVVDRAA
jgi:hypothetical protein